MPESLTPAAKRVLNLAQLEAETWARLEPIHVLLALLREPCGAAVIVFHELRVSAETLYQRVAALADREPRVSVAEGTPVSIEVLRIFELAAEEAREGGYGDVDTDQILLGLVCLAKPPISTLLARSGLTADSIRSLIPGAGTLKKRANEARERARTQLLSLPDRQLMGVARLLKAVREGAAEPIKKDILDVRRVIERSTSKVSLRDLEQKGFRKVKVLRAGDVNQLIHKAVQTVVAQHPTILGAEEKEKILADAKAEYERQTKELQKLQEDQDAVEQAKANLEARLAQVSQQLAAEKNKILEARKHFEEEKRQLEREKSTLSEKAFDAIQAAQKELDDVDQRIAKAVELALAKQSATPSPAEKSLIVLEAKVELERQGRLLRELEERQKALDAAREKLEQRIAKVNARILGEIAPPLSPEIAGLALELVEARSELEAARRSAELYDAARQKLREMVRGLFDLEQKLAPPPPLPASPLVACPFGHGPMDRVIREGVRLAVCPECLSTLLEPGQLDALVKKLSELSIDALHRFLEGENA